MIEWFNSLESLLRTFWGIAIFFSLFFVIQNILTLIGLGGSDADGIDGLDGIDADTSSDGDTLGTGGATQLFTIRNLVNFMLGVGWGGVCFYQYIENHLLLCLVSLIVGIVFVVFFYFVWKKMLRLERKGNINIQECVGCVCDVYLRIPASQSGMGKVQVSFSGSVQELQAMTDSTEMLPSGSKVRVLKVIDGNTLLVEKA